MDTRELSGDGNVLKLDCGNGCTTVCLKTKETGYGCISWHIKDIAHKTWYSCYKRESEPLSSVVCESTQRPLPLLLKAVPLTLKTKGPVADTSGEKLRNQIVHEHKPRAVTGFSSRFFLLLLLDGDHEFFLDTKSTATENQLYGSQLQTRSHKMTTVAFSMKRSFPTLHGLILIKTNQFVFLLHIYMKSAPSHTYDLELNTLKNKHFLIDRRCKMLKGFVYVLTAIL